MPHGVYRSKRPSGAQERKAKKARMKLLKTLTGSILHYVKRLDDGQGSSKHTARQSPINEADSSGASVHSAKQQRVKVEEFGEEEQVVKMEEFEAEESAERDSSHESVNEMSDVKDQDLQVLRDVSVWEIPVPYHLQIEIIKRGSASFQNKDGPFSGVTRRNANGTVVVRRLSKNWFYKVMPNGEKILRSWMVYSLVSKKLYCFCCRLFAGSATDNTSKFVTGFQIWWKLNPKVHDHETSREHLCCLEKWKTLAAGFRLQKSIDVALKAKKGKF